MFRNIYQKIAVLLVAPALFALLAKPALANIPSATVVANCSGYTITLSAIDLNAGQSYDITWDIYGLESTVVSGSHTFTATASTFSGSPLTFSVPTVSGAVSMTGAVYLNGYSNSITFSPSSFTCPAPPPPTECVLPPSGTAISGAPVSWNGFTAPVGSVVWINAHLDAKSAPPNGTTVYFTGVNLVVNATNYALPNGEVVFNSATTTPTTVVNTNGSWTTTVNPSFTGDIFFVGQAIPVDANMENGGKGNTGSTLSFTTSSSDSTFQFQWQWSAAVYTSWPGNAAAEIEPVHASLQAGAPQNTAVQKALIQGPRGGGGSNFTGSWSGTGQGNCP